MEPSNNEISYVNPQEYLDQISPKKTKRFSFLDPKVLALIIGVVLLVITLIIFIAINSNPSTPSTKLLAVRAQNMSGLLEYDTRQITEAKYKKAIAETKVVFASDNYLLSQELDLVIDPNVALQEPLEPTLEDLNDAAAENKLTSEYISVLRENINLIISALEDIKAESKTEITAVEQSLLDLSEILVRLGGN